MVHAVRLCRHYAQAFPAAAQGWPRGSLPSASGLHTNRLLGFLKGSCLST